jgi:hypothetical protein
MRDENGPLRGPLFGLAPDGVFRASAIALGAVGSYPTVSPLLVPGGTSGLLSVALSVETALPVSPVSIPGRPHGERGYTASRPVEFGASQSFAWFAIIGGLESCPPGEMDLDP